MNDDFGFDADGSKRVNIIASFFSLEEKQRSESVERFTTIHFVLSINFPLAVFVFAH